jgi:hypothetical protein
MVTVKPGRETVTGKSDDRHHLLVLQSANYSGGAS